MSDFEARMDSMFRGRTIGRPSENLRRTLVDLLASQARGSVAIGDLLRTLFGHSRVAQAVALPGVSDLAGISGTAERLPPIEIDKLVERGSGIASEYGHNEITELHLLLATLESHTADVTVALRPLVEEYRRLHPKGTRREQLLLEFAPHLGAKYVAEAESLIGETPFSTEGVRTRVVQYLSSRFYPYSEREWRRFQEEHPRVGDFHEDPVGTAKDLRAFLAHGYGTEWTSALDKRNL